MEPVLSSDDSCDSERTMKNQLSEYGLDEENLSKQEMLDILRALKNSKSTAKDDELMRQKVDEKDCDGSPKLLMKRRYINVRDRRLPWSLLPATITPAEKARTLAVYIKLMSLNTYHQARQSVNMTIWPPAIQILEETRTQPLRSTRSGRSVPIYAGFDDDSCDFDSLVTISKKRRESNSDQSTNGGYSKRSLSLKRKSSKDENNRPTKEFKTNNESIKVENDIHRVNIYELIED